ncbi:MAG: ParB N-terminal domain-containing protein [Desulfobacteraceae bacterium]|nr:ParB N-terminal domain-containing protein [Desulfobacteraceae bacterium]
MRIDITCQGSNYKPINELEDFQGALKSIDKKSMEKLQRSILKHGFSFPVMVWGSKIMDGHHRIRAVRELLDRGYVIDDIPVVEIHAEDEAEAGRKLLALNSQYAGMTEQGLHDFLETKEIDIDDIMEDLNLPDINIDDFLKNLDGDPDPDKNGGEKTELIKDGSLSDLAPSNAERKTFEGKKVIIEFSGGKDSSASAAWCKYFFPDNEIVLNYADLGADYVSMPKFLHEFAEDIGLSLVVSRSGQSIHNMFMGKGDWPRFSHPYCHNLLHQALDGYLRTYNPADVVVVRGGRMSEKAAASKVNTDRFLQISRNKEYVYFQPLYFAGKGVGETIIEAQGLPLWPGYSYGLQRTCCRICPGQRPVTYASIRRNFPDVWQELMWLQDRFGPGCWNDPVNNQGQGELVYLADKGESELAAGDYATMY